MEVVAELGVGVIPKSSQILGDLHPCKVVGDQVKLKFDIK